MQEAYQAIEWKVIFLIASMLPLGIAIQNTGAAQMGAEVLINMVGDLGPRWVVGTIFFVSVIGTQVIPTAALVGIDSWIMSRWAYRLRPLFLRCRYGCCLYFGQRIEAWHHLCGTSSW